MKTNTLYLESYFGKPSTIVVDNATGEVQWIYNEIMDAKAHFDYAVCCGAMLSLKGSTTVITVNVKG